MSSAEIENQVGNAVDVLLDLSKQLEEIKSELEEVNHRLKRIERSIE